MSAPSAPLRISVAEAERIVLGAMPRWPPERASLSEAFGRVLREAVTAERDQPPFDRVTMDGIAIAHAGLASTQRRFRIAGTVAAGATPPALRSPSDCIEVMTGSALPEGADTIVPVERLRRAGDGVAVQDDYAATAGQFIHRRGSDHRAGDIVLEAGTVIRAPEMAILTIGGHDRVLASAQPRIAVISTGDELVEAGAPIGDFQIRSSNDRALEAALRGRGYSDISRLRLRDDPAELERGISRAYESADLLVLTGGVSMGQFDHVPRTLEKLGVTMCFHKIMQRPGLPMWFGTGGTDTAIKPVFALPGNPVSSLVCLVRYVIPALAAALGARRLTVPRVKLAEPVSFAPNLTWFLPVRLAWNAAGDTLAVPRPTNTSGDFVGLRDTDGFVELAREEQHFPAGHGADFHTW